MKILIVEDEPITAHDLAETIKAVAPEAIIVSIIHTVEEGLAFLKQKPELDLIFSDIQLGDGLCFRIYEAFLEHPPIVFCTAFNQYAIDAFKTHGIDYLLKPFSKRSVLQAIEKFQRLKSKFNSPPSDFTALIKTLEKSLYKRNQSIIIRQGDKIIPVDVNDVALFFVENENVYAFTFEQKKLLMNQKLESLQESFAPLFFRANRQFLVNRSAIKEAVHSFNRKMIIHLTIPFKLQIEIGKLKVTQFLAWLENNP
jgi:DNA-binding LytR/AlgR family response regulator